ncbi:MAG: hypothetical protein LBB64_05480, partial [Dysgonamonadaceae bacterium]|nr:hypothetical protein [Dysgonamonadaceae bacterium]
PVTESCTSFLADVGHGHFDIHVSKSGNDTGNGSVTEPFLTIGHAVSKAVPGDKVIIHEGVYREDNHYAGRKGLTAPWTQKAAEKLRPEGEGFGADHPGFGTLLFYTDKKQPSL